MKPCKVIAEIGCTHVGNMDRARELISLARWSGADYVKFQKRNPAESTPSSLRDCPHPNRRFAYGSTYLEHRINVELSIEQHAELFWHCKHSCVEYVTSVWDVTSAQEVIEHIPHMSFIKIPSACNQDWQLIHFVLENWDKKVHISTGMLVTEQIDPLLDLASRYPDKIVLYHCTSEYPCPFEHLYLNEISRLRHRIKVYGHKVGVGFSNHGRGIAADIAAYMLGAEYIERHFIDDHLFKHSDAAMSLEPDEMKNLCRDLKAVHAALQSKAEISPDEQSERCRLRAET